MQRIYWKYFCKKWEIFHDSNWSKNESNSIGMELGRVAVVMGPICTYTCTHEFNKSMINYQANCLVAVPSFVHCSFRSLSSSLFYNWIRSRNRKRERERKRVGKNESGGGKAIEKESCLVFVFRSNINRLSRQFIELFVCVSREWVYDERQKIVIVTRQMEFQSKLCSSAECVDVTLLCVLQWQNEGEENKTKKKNSVETNWCVNIW